MQISEPKAIRALAHPLRLDLLEVLAATGPATAAECSRVLGVSQANCSFHLRQLAKYGFVQDAGPGDDRRERRWLVADARMTVRIQAEADTVVRQQLERLVVEREVQAILNYAGRKDGDFPGWEQKAGLLAAVVALSAQEAGEIKEKWKQLLEPYVARTLAQGAQPVADQRYVRYFLAATPLDGHQSENSKSGDSADESPSQSGG